MENVKQKTSSYFPRLASSFQSLSCVLCVVAFLAACSEFSKTPSSTPASGGAGRPIGDAHFGVYIKGAAWNKTLLFDLEKAVGHEFRIIHWFTNWNAPFEGDLVKRVLELNRLPLITWQSSNKPLSEISTGRHDAYLRTWARGVRAVGGDVYIRLFPEMNGNWTPWHGNPQQLVAAWQHVVKLFRAEGATNAKWVWTPNVTDEPATTENRMELYYPGANYVDVLGLDGYNWGTTRPYTAWKSFETIFQTPYNRITALGNQPVWLAEVASTEHGGDKGDWVSEMLSSTAFPRISAVVWFNENKETDWRMESSPDSLRAFQTWFDSNEQAPLVVASR
jgi:hypothetical protein